MTRTFIVLIEAHGDEAPFSAVIPSATRCTALWLTRDSATHGTKVTAKDPIDALHKLATALERQDRRQAAVNAIDAGDDDTQ